MKGWWWQLKYIFYFQPKPWGNDPIWRAYFSNGLVQPPTSERMVTMFFWVYKCFLMAMFQASGMYLAECFFQDFTGVFLFGEHLRLFSHHLETFMNPSLCPIVGAKAQAFRLWLVAVLSKSNQGCFPVLFVLGLPSIIRSEWQARSFQTGWAAFSFITRLASWKPTYPLPVGTFEWMIFLFPRWDMDLLPERVLFSPTFFQALHLWERLVVSGEISHLPNRRRLQNFAWKRCGAPETPEGFKKQAVLLGWRVGRWVGATAVALGSSLARGRSTTSPLAERIQECSAIH